MLLNLVVTLENRLKVGTNFVKREPNLTEESKTNPSDVPEFEDLETQERYAVRASYISVFFTVVSNHQWVTNLIFIVKPSRCYTRFYIRQYNWFKWNVWWTVKKESTTHQPGWCQQNLLVDKQWSFWKIFERSNNGRRCYRTLRNVSRKSSKVKTHIRCS